jgi:hypothetical protein
MCERDDKPGDGLRLNVIGRSWKDDSSGSPMIRETLRIDQRVPRTRKASQEHWITRFISARPKEQGLNAGLELALRASV